MRIVHAHDEGVDMYKYCLYIMNFAGSVDAALLPRSRLSVLFLPHRFGSIAYMLPVVYASMY